MSKMINRKYIVAEIFFMVTLLSLPTAALSSNPKDQHNIVIPLNGWSSQKVISRAIGNILKKKNYRVSYYNISSKNQWGALARGTVHFQIEVWPNSTDNQFNKMLKLEKVIAAGEHSAMSIEDWWYPDYVEKLCPGLPDWRALNKCSKLFSDNNTDRGVYYSGPWDYNDSDLIRGLHLKFNIKRLKNSEQLWTILHQAEKEKRAIMMFNWSPNWTDARIPGNFVKFPDYDSQCESDISWGYSKNFANDCENPRNGHLHKAVWPKLKTNYPCVMRLIKRVNLTNLMIAEAAALVDVDKFTEDKAANLWLDKFSEDVLLWSNFTCKSWS